MKLFVLTVSIPLFICLYSCDSFIIREKRDLKSDLIVLVNDLLLRADQEIKILQQQNKTENATELMNIETKIKELEVKLNQATDQNEINKLEDELTTVGGRLYIVLDLLGIQLNAKEERLALIVTGEALILRANNEIQKLVEQNRTNSVQLIKAEEQQITALVAQLKNATLEVDVEDIELRLLEAENQLRQELLRIGVAWNVTDVKIILLRRATELISRINTVVERLQQEANAFPVRENEFNRIIASFMMHSRSLEILANDLRNTVDEELLMVIELNIINFEFSIEIELANIGESVVTTHERQLLITELEELAAKLLIESRKLMAKNRTLEAEGLFREQQYLVDLDVEARNAVNAHEFLFIERTFRQIETRILELLKQSNV